MGLPYVLEHALKEIESLYGDRCEIAPKSLLKFGKNELVGTSYATVATMPSGVLNETYVSTNIITHISSSNAGDGQAVIVQGHKIVGSVYYPVSQSVTLSGQTKVALATPMVRVNRLYNNGTTDFAGAIYVFEDDTLTAGVPDTDTKVHLTTDAAVNTSFKASTSISHNEYWIITQMMGSINKKTTALVDMEIEIRMLGKVFLVGAVTSLNDAGVGTIAVPLDPAIIVPKNADVRLKARASTTSVSVSGWMNGYIATVKQT